MTLAESLMVRGRQGDDVGFPVVVDDAVVIVIVVVVEEVVDFQETLPLNLHQLRSGRLDTRERKGKRGFTFKRDHYRFLYWMFVQRS